MIRHASALAALVLSLSAVACAAPNGDDASTAETAQEVVGRSIQFDAFQDAEGNCRFHVTAGNGAILATSEAYASAEDAESAIAEVLEHGNHPRWFEVALAETGGFTFSMKSESGAVLLTSDPYASQQSADRGLSVFRSLVRVEQQERLAAAAQPSA